MKPLFLGFGNAAKIILEELEDLISDFYYYDEKKITNGSGTMLEEFYIPDDSDMVIECASVGAVRKYYREILSSNKDFYILSTGAFADEDFRRDFNNILEKSQSNVFLPSGAIGGVDVIYAIKKYIDKVFLRTYKPPISFGRNDKEKTLIFSGNAIEAIKRFPRNTNVSVTLSFAVGSFEKVFVEIYSDPNVKRNIHKIEINSSVGNYIFSFDNIQSPNPRTSMLAPLSLASLIRKRFEKVKIGG
ncbi:aspartate dehydrogenase [Thermosipho melanesiensis]|uniref:L-aspartate dehydrogenase n=2 Tax=Thermosipho melanesiensis TaxID=46541 RepID=A6LNC5_THEM4|nr:aspartate dehydrogenase [Thermosipho melanesiensis]ABR31426.1 Aspartate dehydrogenase [Thermosipho melanesiensis BI429]APT74485.1 aspartate dehydrogenase [Thermosipho melanesiensis]OOC36444.1 aspartate dehydrogenase [Thermosipho melanesiensis]OOC37262.1 aspartate dehydrogenase [Thermosipho melanesiensis]OOC38014.1 aspartate dehydrogenase [Thermosipho melanesiensis]